MRNKRLYFNISEMNLLLVFSSLFSVGLVFARVVYTLTPTYLALIWNLFLAWIPYISSYLLYKKSRQRIKDLIFFPWIGFWILFYPNAPYIITDLFHLAEHDGIPQWFDLVLIFSFALNGLVLSVLSMHDIQKVITRKYNKRTGWVLTAIFLLLSGFGVYLGRYLRWNSWDVFTQTLLLFSDLKHILVNPLQNAIVYGFTLVFSSFLMLFYFTVIRIFNIMKQK